MKRVVFRGDDAASTEGANLAIAQAVQDGVLRNVSVMVPGPALAHAAEVLKGLEGIAIGLHVTLNSEWEEVKWGPVRPASEVPSLVEPDGSFTTEPKVLRDRGFSVEEAMAEVEAQLALLRSTGLKVDYLDEHMGVGWLPGLRERLAALCERESLVDANRVAYLRDVDTGDAGSIIGAILRGPDEPFVVVTHPLPNVDPVARRFTAGGRQPGEILRERANDRRSLTDPRLVEFVQTGRIASITYPEAVERP
ncbi:MAG: ChbG/HpnK family deacetylase [Fimbriimonas sp.]